MQLEEDLEEHRLLQKIPFLQFLLQVQFQLLMFQFKPLLRPQLPPLVRLFQFQFQPRLQFQFQSY